MDDPTRPPDADGDYPGAPRWVKVFEALMVAVVVLFVMLTLARGPGGHGPGRHMPSGDAPP